MSKQYPYGVFDKWFYTMLYRYGGKEYLERLINYLKSSHDHKASYYDPIYEPDWLTQYSDNTLIMAHWDIMCCRWGDTNEEGMYIHQGCLDTCIGELQEIRHRQNLYSMMCSTS